MRQAEEIKGLFPDFYRKVWDEVGKEADSLQEIRLRVGQPLMLLIKNREFFLTKAGKLLSTDGGRTIPDNALIVEKPDLDRIVNHIFRYSRFAYEEELRQGYLTVSGGYRIGIVGQVVSENGEIVRTIKHISGLNIRVAHEIRGVGDKVMPFLYEKGRFVSTMIISPPGCGKTTLLRDVIRQVSEGNPYGDGCCVGVVDERSELAGSYMGIAQNDLGIRTDVLDACPKAIGMMMLLRSMSPAVVAVDEIGSKEDVNALLQVLQCGSSLLVTIHGSSMEEIRNKKNLERLLAQKEFKRFIILGKKGTKCVVREIYDGEYRLCSGWQG